MLIEYDYISHAVCCMAQSDEDINMMSVVFPRAGVGLHLLANNIIYPSVFFSCFLFFCNSGCDYDDMLFLRGTILPQSKHLSPQALVLSPSLSLSTHCHNQSHNLTSRLNTLFPHIPPAVWFLSSQKTQPHMS